MKTLYMTLSPDTSKGSTKSIKEMIDFLEEYKKELLRKNDVFVHRLAEIGVKAAEQRLATGEGDADRDARFSMVFQTTEGICEGQVIISSTPHTDELGRTFYPHLAWEFGAGIYYNNGNANPKAKEFGLGVGTFPMQKHALNDYWWYRDDSGTLRMSKGTEATMPMYNASKEIIQKIEIIAREVFGGQ